MCVCEINSTYACNTEMSQEEDHKPSKRIKHRHRHKKETVMNKK